MRLKQSCTIEEILEKLDSLQSEKALWVELDSFDGIALVPHTHDFSLVCPGYHNEFVGDGVRLNHQAVIPGCLEWIGQVPVHSLPIVMNPRGLAMHDAASPNNPGS
jgi:hypothetical protein